MIESIGAINIKFIMCTYIRIGSTKFPKNNFQNPVFNSISENYSFQKFPAIRYMQPDLQKPDAITHFTFQEISIFYIQEATASLFLSAWTPDLLYK